MPRARSRRAGARRCARAAREYAGRPSLFRLAHGHLNPSDDLLDYLWIQAVDALERVAHVVHRAQVARPYDTLLLLSRLDLGYLHVADGDFAEDLAGPFVGRRLVTEERAGHERQCRV